MKVFDVRMLNHLLRTSKKTIGRARRLRVCRETSSERRLWTQLRGRKLSGVKFRRQVPIGPFIADFLCVQAKLIIELDGDSHDFKQSYDRRRTFYLKNHGYRLIRYTNDQIFTDLEGVLADITNKTKTSPLPWGEGQGEGEQFNKKPT